MFASQQNDVLQNATEYILQHKSGDGWPYIPKGSPSVEATAWCAIALRRKAEIRRQVARNLLEAQNAEGGWSTQPGAGKSDWTTSLALLALRVIAGEDGWSRKDRAAMDSAFQKALAFLVANRTDMYSRFGKILVFLKDGPGFENYPRGWPWTPGTYNWVEPTSYTLMAIKPTKIASRKDVNNAIVYANRFLIDHACADGGWNHGNNVCLSVNLPPYPVTTAEALLALQNLKDDPDAEPAISQAVDFLKAKAPEHNTVMSLAWAALSMHSLDQPYQPLLDLLEKHQKKDGSLGDNLMLAGLAATALAINEGGSPVKFSDCAKTGGF